jgi:MYXO-CTERM domain-containing protein
MRAASIAAGAAGLILLATATPAAAFCGFYVGGAGAEMFNHATEVVLMRHGTTTVLSMQNNYQGPPDKFALVVPVPVVVREQNVKTLPRELFAKVDTLGAPRLVEYWEEDPCHPQIDEDEDGADDAEAEEKPRAKKKMAAADDDYKVKIEAKFSVGEYDIVVLSAQESTGLDRWLRANKYEIPKGAEPLLRPYVEQGTKFFVAKVDPKKVRFENGMATLSPLRFHYDSPEFSLPIRLGLANSSGAQDLIVNILAPNGIRYEVANYPNVTIPTNLTVNDGVRTRFGEFYAALFDHTLKQVPNAVVTEYSWTSSSCDPCPGPTLDPNDVATLGGDVIASTYKNIETSRFNLTRLHARYGKEVTSDLVFRAVEPIVGGRGVPNAQGRIDTSVGHAAINNFQGRYVILHPWTGAMACPSPQRGVWGGPDQSRQIAAKAATDLAFAPRGNVDLASLLASSVPGATRLDSKSRLLPSPPHQPHGCGCNTDGGAAPAGAMLTLALVLRRRRRQRSA